jgi:hypothetical protein
VGGFYLSLLYLSGKQDGQYKADGAIATLGTGAVAVLVLWIAIFFIYGASIYVRNTLGQY